MTLCYIARNITCQGMHAMVDWKNILFCFSCWTKTKTIIIIIKILRCQLFYHLKSLEAVHCWCQFFGLLLLFIRRHNSYHLLIVSIFSYVEIFWWWTRIENFVFFRSKCVIIFVYMVKLFSIFNTEKTKYKIIIQ